MNENEIKNEMSPYSLMEYVSEKSLRMDRNLELYPMVETEGSKYIEERVKIQENTIIIGEEGVGKSAATSLAATNLILNEGKKVFIFLGKESITDIYNNLWLRISLPPQLSDKVMDFLYTQTQVRNWMRTSTCKYWSCPKKDRCVFDIQKYIDNLVPPYIIKKNLDFIEVPCPMKRNLVLVLLNQRFVVDYLKQDCESILIDLANKFTNFDAKYLDNLILLLQRIGNIVIVMSIKQYLLCSKYENLKRIPYRPFPPISTNEIKEIIKSRIETCKRHEFDISDNALERIIQLTDNNVRKTINLCGLYIDQQKFPSLTTNVRILQKLQPNQDKKSLPRYLTKDEETIISVITTLKIDNPRWIKVKEIKNTIWKDCDIDISSERIGKLLKNKLKLRQRYNPDSEYLI